MTSATDTSKFMSYVLRHAPQSIGLDLDANGWASLDDLIDRANAAGTPLTRDSVLAIVAQSDKKRFTLSEDGRRIRAAQGHSVAVDLNLAPAVPPAILFHGTADRFLEAILREGLDPRDRQHVHLSADAVTAVTVGARHGKPVVLRVDAGAMHAAGLAFWRADNGVWLTGRVPSSYLSLEGKV
jgi:putative RNA 2'-phosphotransferase